MDECRVARLDLLFGLVRGFHIRVNREVALSVCWDGRGSLSMLSSKSWCRRDRGVLPAVEVHRCKMVVLRGAPVLIDSVKRRMSGNAEPCVP